VGLIDDLGPGPVALDTCIFIYIVEANAEYAPLLDPLLMAMTEGRLVSVTSALTLLEVLVVPLRAGDASLADQYERYIYGSKGLHLLDIAKGVLRRAALLRAGHPTLRTPDAIQMATAMVAGCTVLITNDRAMPSLEGLRILQLKDYLVKTQPPRGRPLQRQRGKGPRTNRDRSTG
jgi:predicted nucleic acid-binding protein